MSTSLDQRSEANASLGGSGQVPIQFQDEGSNLGTAGTATTVNFTGAGVTASRATNTVTVNVPGGAGEAFPVGSIYLAVVSTNPGTLLGYGTWASIGAGRVLVGLDSGDTDFDTVEETGGAKTVAAAGSNSAPTFTGSALGTHSHGVGTISAGTHSAHSHTVGTISAGTHPAHNHSAGTLAPSAHSGTAVADHTSASFEHTHEISTGGSATISAHTSHGHGSKTASFTSGSSPYFDTDTVVAAHTLGGYTQGMSGGPTPGHSVTQPSAHTMSGSTADDSAWPTGHTMSGSTATDSTVAGHSMSGSTSGDSAGTPAGSVSAPTFTGSATSVLQPYFVCYMWKRTA